MSLKIDINVDTVEIEGQLVFCPRRIAPSEWMAFWERVVEAERKKNAGLGLRH